LQKQTNIEADQALGFQVNLPTQVITTSTTSQQTTAVGAGIRKIVIQTTKAAWFAVGSNPTATVGGAGSFYLPDGGQSYPIFVSFGVTKVAVIQDSVSGIAVIIEST
jgi:hypothetical protein